ncbi:hypothetical protein [Mycobacterium sp. SMC-19]|uniref:hypothetical protein n=1 Tax=Mycobacterium sp. SMC-19 TaxID=3381630 RepID=UPI003876267B
MKAHHQPIPYLLVDPINVDRPVAYLRNGIVTLNFCGRTLHLADSEAVAFANHLLALVNGVVGPMSTYTVPQPPGADPGHTDEFETDDTTGITSRCVWSPTFELPAPLPDLGIRVGAVQLDDGTLVIEGPEAPRIFADSGNYSAADARALAGALLAAADLTDQWVVQ